MMETYSSSFDVGTKKLEVGIVMMEQEEVVEYMRIIERLSEYYDIETDLEGILMKIESSSRHLSLGF